MQQQQFIDIIKKPHLIESAHLADLEVLVNEYPFFESAHLLYTKGLHKHQALNYSKQLRKTAIVVNSRSVLYELLHQPEVKVSEPIQKPVTVVIEPIEVLEEHVEVKKTGSVSVTNDEIKVIYVNTVPSINTISAEKEVIVKETNTDEIDIIKSIENETEVPVQDFSEDKLNKTIEQEINKSIIQSYVETDIIKTPELHKEEVSEPSSFTDWLKTIQKEAHTFQIETKTEKEQVQESDKNGDKKTENEKNAQLLD